MVVSLSNMDRSDDRKVTCIHGVPFRVIRNRGTAKSHHGVKAGPYWSVRRVLPRDPYFFELVGHFETLTDVRKFLTLIEENPILLRAPITYVRGLGALHRRMPDRSYERYQSLY